MINEKINKIISELDSTEIDDEVYRKELRSQIESIITENMNESINFLKTNCSSKIFVIISGMLPRIIRNTKNSEFLQEYKKLIDKYPEEKERHFIEKFVGKAEEYLK